MREINEIIIHCTATTPDFMKDMPSLAKVIEVKRWHVEQNGWSNIGYHWLVDRDGRILPGRIEEVQGAHTKGRNHDSIGVALFGGYASNENDDFSDHYTPEQDAALRNLLTEISERHDVYLISGHNQYAAKACPGFQVGDWLKSNPLISKPSTPKVAPKSDWITQLIQFIAELLKGFKK